MTKRYSINRRQQLNAIAHDFLKEHSRAVIYLSGDLGTGKTTFAQTLISALGYQGVVQSPTYALMNEYESTRGKVIHADLYRLYDAEELWELDVREWSSRAHYVLIEWAERGGNLLPPPDWFFSFSLSQKGRFLEIKKA